MLKEELDNSENEHGRFKFKYTFISVGYIYDNIVSTYVVDDNKLEHELSAGDDRLKTPSNKKSGRSRSKSSGRKGSMKEPESVSTPVTTNKSVGSPRMASLNVVEEFRQLENYTKVLKIYEKLVADIRNLYDMIENFIKKYKLYILSLLGAMIIFNIQGMFTGSRSSHP